jgi:uncharacterized protein
VVCSKGNRVAGVLVGALLASSAARAQDVAHLQAAHRFLDASGAVNLMVAAIRANLPAQRAAAPKVPEEFWTRFEARIVQDAPQLVDSIAVIYARSFSVEDLQALVAFYTSPTGQRLKNLQPALVSQSTQVGQRWGARIAADVGASLQH